MGAERDYKHGRDAETHGGATNADGGCGGVC